MKSFSERLGYTRAVITDEAPQWLRTSFFNTMLEDFVEFGSYSAHAPVSRILPAGEFMSEIGISVQKNFSRLPFNPNAAQAMLEEILSSLPWEHFYGSLELAHGLLSPRKAPTAFYYMKKLNDLFLRANVAWQMNSNGQLVRTLPPDVVAIETQLQRDAQLGDPVKQHLIKARKFLDSKPSDPPNVIKESVQALESFARVKTNTKSLGDALKAWKQSDQPIPPILIVAMEKLYGFASAEAGVRHGSPDEERLVREDAEFVYFIALAMLRYLRGIE